MASVCTVSASFVSARASPAAPSAKVGAPKAFAGARLSARPARFALAVAKPQPAVAAAATESLGADVWNKSYYPKAADHLQVNKPWYVIDAEGQTLGRLSTLVANHLRGANT